MTCALLEALAALTVARTSWADGRGSYEVKCLYCHSSDVVEQQRLRPSQWRKVVERMRASAPLLIGPRDVEVIVRFLVRDMKLIPREEVAFAKRAPRKPPTTTSSPAAPAAPASTAPPDAVGAPSTPSPAGTTPWVAAPEEAMVPVDEPGPPPPPPPTPEELALEEEAPRLLQEKCSKCHTVYRVFTKLDSQGAAESTLERMRKKTGSGISPDDAEVLRRFIASRMAP